MHTRKIGKSLVRHFPGLTFVSHENAIIQINELQISIIEEKIHLESFFALIAAEKCSTSRLIRYQIQLKCALKKKLAENISDDPVTLERMQE